MGRIVALWGAGLAVKGSETTGFEIFAPNPSVIRSGVAIKIDATGEPGVARYHRAMEVSRTEPADAAAALPRDAQGILALAARSLFSVLASASEGMLLVDREARVVWINDQYRRFLPALGFAREEDFVGHTVSAVVQNTQMHKVLETGKPILIDLLTNRAGTFVVSRIPLRDDGGEVIGALGIVLFDQPQESLQPLIAKFSQLPRGARGRLLTRSHAPAAPAPRRWRARARRGARRARAARCCCWARPAPARNCSRTPSTPPRRARRGRS
jgi:PAS domain-containing protein